MCPFFALESMSEFLENNFIKKFQLVDIDWDEKQNVVVVQSLSGVWLFVTLWTAAP